MAFWPSTLGVFICLLVCSARSETITMTSPMPTPSVNMSMNASMHMNSSPSEIQPSIHWINGSCRIMPSTCICDSMKTVNISMNISMINMTSSSSQVVSMTMTPDHTGSSYLTPMNATIHPNMTSNHTAVPCTCYGLRTWCRKNFTVSPTPTILQPPNTAETNNNNNNNNGNNGNNNNIVSSSVSPVPHVSPSVSLLLPFVTPSDGGINPTLMPSYTPSASAVSATAPLGEATVTMNMSVSPVPMMSMDVSGSMSVSASPSTENASMEMSLSPSASMAVVMEASTTPGGEVIPVPTTLPPVCSTDCIGVDCGTAIVNSCGHCVGGTTSRLDVNFGKDCNNVCNGTARNDSCGACSNPPANDPTSVVSPFRDCNNDCFKNAAIDACGNCSGGLTGRAPNFWMDSCGICGGDNSSCLGCDGVPNSGKIKDSCGVCGGDGSTCTNITSVYPSLLPSTSTSGRTVTVTGAGLTGSAIKCVLDGEESEGTVVNITLCQCSIPDNITAGTKSFTVKVVNGDVDTPTSDLQIKIYDATVVKITTVTPAEFLTGTPAQLTFEGSGLIVNPAAVCVINTDTVVKIPAVFDSGNYNCSLPGYEMATNMTVGLSINGIHELNSDADLNRKVFALAPAVTSPQFTDTGAKIIIAFDKPIATASLTTCSAIFNGLTALGTNPTCSWSDSRHLEISPDVDATIEPGNTLAFKNDIIKQDQMFFKFLNGDVTILAPENPVKPVPVIFGPTQISSCGHLTLDGSQSSGGGGRNLEYNWTLEGQVDDEITQVLNAAEDVDRVLINGTLMSPGTTYEFKLAVSNFLSPQAVETNISVTKATDPTPEVTLEGPLQGKAMAGNSFYVTATAKAASCSTEKALSYSWSVLCTNDDTSNSAKTRAESSPGFRLTSNKAALKIDAGSLVGDKTYRFTVVVSLTASPNTATTMSTNVAVEWSPLEPAIAGGDRTLGLDSGTLELDAKSSTVDPDNAPGELSCAWSCTDTSNEQPCYSAVNKQSKISFPNDCLVSLSSAEFEAGKVYRIQSAVSKGSRIGSSAMLLTVLEGNPPAVSVVTPTMKVTADQRVSLEAKYTSSVQPTVEWICAQEDDYRYIDLSDQSIISSSSNQYSETGTSFTSRVLKANVLTPGSKYKFIVNVNDGSKIGSSNIIVEVRSGPTSGSFVAEPTTLEQLQEVTLKAPLWVTDADAYPLEYEFGFLDNTGVFQPWRTQTSNEYTIAVPPGYGPNNILTLRVKVKDFFGSVKYMNKNITVTEPSSIDESLVENLITDTLQEAMDSGDYSEAIPNMLNILSVVKNSNSSDNLTAKVMNITAETLVLAVDATLLDEEKAKPMLETFLELDVETLQTTKEILDSFEKVAVAHDGNLAIDKVDKSLKFLEDLAGKCDLSDSEVVEDLVSIDNEVASSLAGLLNFGDAAVEKSSTRCDIVAQHSLLTGDIPTKSGTQSSQVEFGNEMRTKYGFWECDTGKYCLGVKLTFVNYKQDYYTTISSNKPGILPSKVLSVTMRNPETGSALPVSGLNDRITITFDTGVPSAGKTFKGYYYSESQDKWSDYGLTSTMEGSKLKVTTNHLTSFAPAEENSVNPTNNQSGVTTIAPSSDNVFQVSFVLSNTTWNDTYSNSSHPAHKALKDAILTELSNVYQGDATLKNIVLDKFEPSGDYVKVVLKMTFDDSNDDPGAKLKDSLSNGKLGNIGVDKDSVTWVNSYTPSESESEEDTEVIVGTVFGIFFGLAFILLGAAWLKNRQSRHKVGSSHPSINEDPCPPDEPEAVEETPA